MQSYEGSNRFLTHPKESIHQHLTALFGTEQWRCSVYCAKKNRQERFSDLYRARLRAVGKATYVCMFRLKNRRNRTGYFLVFGTHQRASVEWIKNIFWEINSVCGYTYSVYQQEKYADQPHLLPSEPDYGVLTRQLCARLAGSALTISNLEKYILAEITFRAVG